MFGEAVDLGLYFSKEQLNNLNEVMKFEAPNQSWHDNSWKTKIFNLSLTD
jgi:hypothetical protein